MNFRVATPSLLVDIQHIEGLKGVSIEDESIVIKAMTRHRELELHPDVRRFNPLVAEIMQHVAHVPIRNRGTVVGSLCHADPSAEMPLLFVLLDGMLVATGPSGTRRIPAAGFFQSFLTTARRQDEIVVEAWLPVLPKGHRLGIRRGDTTTRRLCAWSASAACFRSTAAASARDLRLAACGISDRPVRLKAAEAALNGSALAAADLDAAAGAAAAAVTQADDMNTTKPYRRRVLGRIDPSARSDRRRSCARGGPPLKRSAIRPSIPERSDDPRVDVSLTVNRQPVRRAVSVRMLLSDFLRHELGLTGTHVGCEHGVCGCCTVHIDGKAGRSCLTLAVQANGCKIRTIEDVAAADGTLHPVQQAFRECHALQCGFCTPGMVMNVLSRFEEREPLDLSESGIREMLSGNLCRCTGYINIIAAVRRAAELLGRT